MAKHFPAGRSDEPEGGLIRTAPGNLDSWGVQVGDIVTNLRASLDHIAWALAMKRVDDTGKSLNPAQEKRIYFPIKAVPDKAPIIGGLSESAVHFFPPAVHSTIEQFQPYNRADRPELDLLYLLETLAGFDKHRIVTPTRTRTTISFATRRFDNEQGDPRSEMQDSLMPVVDTDIVILVGDKLIGIRGFRAIHDLIRNEILPAFSGFFK